MKDSKSRMAYKILKDQNYRYYCNNDKCRWMLPVEQAAFYPDMVDCTDMSDDKFQEFVLKS